jgi:hypothetical protein
MQLTVSVIGWRALHRNIHNRATTKGPLHTPAVTMSMNAVIGDVTSRNRPGSGFVPIGA